ncbi:MAG: outer membrane beta-barrel protein [Verrucomicrobiales bacterium]
MSSYLDNLRAHSQNYPHQIRQFGAEPGAPVEAPEFRPFGAPVDPFDPYSGYGTSHALRYGRQLGHYSGVNDYSRVFNAASAPAPTQGAGNIRLGPLNWRVGLNAYAEYNDNINRSNDNPLEDVILGVAVNTSTSYQLTRYNNWYLNVGWGVDRYLNHEEFSGRGGDEWTISLGDNNALGFNFYIGDVLFNVHDSFALVQQTDDDFALDDFDLFNSFQNNFSVNAFWQLSNKLYLSGGYQLSNQWALDREFDFYDRASHSVFGSLGFTPTGTYTVGMEASASWNDYKRNFQNDGTQYSVGGFLSTPITEYTSVRVGAGYQGMNFDSGGGNLDTNSDYGDYYYNASIQNQLNTMISHSLSFGHEASLNTTSNYRVSDYVRYGVGVSFYRGYHLSASVFYEDSEESGGFLREDTEQWGFDISMSHQLTQKMAVTLGYHYGQTSSSSPGRDYTQHSFSIDTGYMLTRKVRLGIGYQFWTTDADLDTHDFDQNRVIVNLNYAF